MFNIGDRVIHKTTGQVGKVFGYGHQMVDGAYLPTITVRILEETNIHHSSFIEDLSCEWVQVDRDKTSESLTQPELKPLTQSAA